MSFPLPEDEAARLECLHRYNILDTPPEQAFDDITRLASYICGTPISVVSLLDETRQWFKSSVGLEAMETPRDQAFCTHAILQDGLMVVPNALEDGRFAANPLVTGSPHIRFYAGAPLVTSSGQALGALCVIDRVPRTLTPEQAEALRSLSRQVVALLELRRNATEYKRTLLEKERFEQELQISMRLQQAIFDSADYSFISTDPQGIIQTFNRAAERMLGYSAEEMIDNVTPAILHDADEVVARAEILTQELGRNIAPGFEVFTAKIREGTPDENEWTYIRKDGSRFPIRLSATALRNEDGALTGYLGIAQDITTRKQVELAFQRSQEQLEAAQQIARMGSWEYDLATQKIIWSKELFRLFGLAPEQGEPEYAGAVSLYAPEDAARLDACFQRALTEGIGYEMDLQGASSVGGAPRWYHTVGEPVFDAQEKLIRLAGTLIDITERKQIEEALRASEERLRLLVEGVDDYAIFALDTEGCIMTWNAGAVRLKGYTADEIIGKHFSLFYAPKDVAGGHLERALQTARADGKYAGEGWRFRKDGTPFFANVTITPMWDAKGRLHGYSKVTRDITERKQAGETIHSLNRAMEQASEGISHLDTEGRYTSVNEAYANAVGCSAAEMIGMIWLPTVHPDDHAFMFSEYARMKADGKTVSEVRGVRKDGGEFFKQITMVRELDAEGRFIGHHCFMKNITERKQAEETLSRSEARLDEAQRISQMGSWEYDLATGKLAWSKGLFRLFGLSPEQGEPDYATQLALYAPEDAARLDACVRCAVTEGIGYELDLQRTVSEGETPHWYHAVGKPVFDAQGKVIRLTGTLVDITERKQIEEAMRLANERLRLATESGNFGVWEWDILANTLTWDEHMAQLYGFTSETFPGSYAAWSQRLHPDDRERTEAALQEAVQGGRKYAPEFRILLEDGEIRHVKADALVLHDANHQPVRMIGLNQNITERKQNEEALRSNEERFRLLTEVVKDYAIFALDTQGRIVTWNVGAAKLKGYSAEEILGRHFSVFYPQDVAVGDIERELEQARTDSRYDIEGWRMRKDGTRFWAGVTITPMWDGKGHLCGYSKIIRDLTERKWAEEVLQEAHNKLEVRVQQRTEALRKSEALFRATFESAAVGMARVGLDGRWLDVNNKLCEIIGYSRAELFTLTFQDITHPDDLHTDLAYVAQVMTGEIATYSMHKRYVRKNGALVWINLTVALVREVDATPQYFISIVEDITVRKQAEEALKDSETRYRFLADAMPQIVWTARADGSVDYYNQRWFGYTGMTLQETQNWGWKPVVHPDDLERCIVLLMDAYKTGSPYEAECRLKRASDGVYRWHLARSLPLRNEAGEIIQWVGTSTDIEEFKQAHDYLERSVQQRTEQLVMQKEEMHKMTQELVRSNTDLEQFAYVASHDLQEPLRMIGSYLELLQLEYGERLDDEAHEYIAYAVDGAVRMKTLINDLLTYSRVGTQGKTMQTTPTDALLVEVLADLQLLIVGAGAVVTCDPLPTVFADASQLRLVLQNLISNAIKFRGVEAPRLHVSAVESEGEWRFSVQDNGIGMQARHLERIFVIFQRLHNKSKYSGTGIGLAVCKRVVERHGGRIWVESEPGQGSTFFFTLPVSS